MDQLAPADLSRLIKILSLLSSDSVGERAAAGAKAHAFLQRHGLTWSDILVTTPPALGWRQKVRACAARANMLNTVEQTFIRTMTSWTGTPSDRQLAWIDRIYGNLAP
jgi:hypothetical protein